VAVVVWEEEVVVGGVEGGKVEDGLFG